MNINTEGGRVIVYTGDGKGKTTAALGLGLRAFGRGMRVCVVQFIKSKTDTGECRAISELGARFQIHTMGRGFVMKPGGAPEDRAAAEKALAFACSKMNDCDMLILDEINCAVDLKLIDEHEVIELVRSRPPKLNIVLTGRAAPALLIELADTVTEMKNIKHAGDAGSPAAAGIEC